MFRKGHYFRSRNIQQLKQITRILFIDDEDRRRLINYLDSEGWSCRQIVDLARLEDTDLVDSHIVFVDVMGVGQKMDKPSEGLDVVVSIKDRYPAKKVAVYSSQEMHNIFHRANEVVDKRILKRGGDFEVFEIAIEELAQKCFDWDYLVDDMYSKLKAHLPEGFDRDRLRRTLERSVSQSGKVNRVRLVRGLQIGRIAIDVAVPALELFLMGAN